MLALVIADGSAPERGLIDRLLTGMAPAEVLVVAADGGARHALDSGLRPQVVVGDGDSLPASVGAELRSSGVEIITYPVAKDRSDTELAVREALARGATKVLVLGAFGGTRMEHTLANVLMLALPELHGADVALVDERSTVRVIGDAQPASLTVHGAVGDFVSLLPLSERVEGVTTHGLAFPLRDEDLVQGPTRGLSNQMSEPTATVARRAGRLAVIHTLGPAVGGP